MTRRGAVTDHRTTVPSPPLFTVKRAAEHLDLSEKYIRVCIARGELIVRRFGRAVRIPAEALENFGR